jgi:hypothetical protein
MSMRLLLKVTYIWHESCVKYNSMVKICGRVTTDSAIGGNVGVLSDQAAAHQGLLACMVPEELSTGIHYSLRVREVEISHSLVT